MSANGLDMTDDLQHFKAQRLQYFDVVCDDLGLVAENAEIGRGFASVSAASANVRIFFEHDRGLCSFAVGALSDSKPMCGVEELARRFARIRVMPEGSQRLSLEEQREFLQSKWQELQVMFSPQHLRETRKWHKASAAAYMKRFSGDR
jgi:hypothetical protein